MRKLFIVGVFVASLLYLSSDVSNSYVYRRIYALTAFILPHKIKNQNENEKR